MKLRLQYTASHLFLNSCPILFSPIFCFFSFTHICKNNSQYFLKRAALVSKELLKALLAESRHTTVVLGVMYSHHGSHRLSSASHCWMQTFTSHFSSFCKHCRKVKTADRSCLTFLYLWNQHILWETWKRKPSMSFLKYQESQGFVKELGSQIWTSFKSCISALISNVLNPASKKEKKILHLS